MAFGHHRLEAAKRSGLTCIPVIQRDPTDEQMLQFMGRENGEDYATDFLTMLNTWEGAIEFRRLSAVKLQPIDTARLLGWMRKDTSGLKRISRLKLSQRVEFWLVFRSNCVLV